jgi:hypothetical protein
MERQWRSIVHQGIASLVLPCFLVLTLAAISPDLHGNIHGATSDEPASAEHTCVLAQIDGKLTPGPTSLPVAEPFTAHIASNACRPATPILELASHLLPWALAPPVIV